MQSNSRLECKASNYMPGWLVSYSSIYQLSTRLINRYCGRKGSFRDVIFPETGHLRHPNDTTQQARQIANHINTVPKGQATDSCSNRDLQMN